MCTVNEDDLDDLSHCMEREPANMIENVCKKCSERNAQVILRVKDAYCKDCFLVTAVHKFRAALGKSKLVRPQDHILLAFSGSQSSVALAHLVQCGLNEGNHKRLLFSCSVIYVDEGGVLGISSSERENLCNSVVQQAVKFNLPVYVTSLARCLDDSEEICYFRYSIGMKYANEEREEQLKKLITSIHSLTAKDDMVQKLRNQLLLKIAKQLKCTKIFTADTASHLAIKLLSNVALGRGAQLPLDIGFCDTRDQDVMLLRPMRDFMKKEVAYYNTFNGLESVNMPSLETKAGPYASIQKLTEKFVTDLQEEFPSTVSTIFRTGDKLSMGTGTSEADECCVLCLAPLDTTTPESSALQATEFSRMVSTLGPSGFDNKLIGTLSNSDTKLNLLKSLEKKEQSSGGENSSCEFPTTSTSCGKREACHCKKKSISVTLAEAETCLCYSCRLIAREMETLEILPPRILLSIKEHLRYKEMKKEIEDFLL